MKTYYDTIQKCELMNAGESLDKHKYNIEQVFKIIHEAKKEISDGLIKEIDLLRERINAEHNVGAFTYV